MTEPFEALRSAIDMTVTKNRAEGDALLASMGLKAVDYTFGPRSKPSDGAAYLASLEQYIEDLKAEHPDHPVFQGAQHD